MKTQRPSQIAKSSARASKRRAHAQNFPASVRALPASARGFLVALEKSANTRSAFPASGQNFPRYARCLPASQCALSVTRRPIPDPLRRLRQRLNPNRATFLQNAATLQGNAATDDLPGFKTPAARQAIADAIAAYQTATATQQESDEQAGQDRIACDKLVKAINARRMAIQHAADALYPYTDPDNLPTRRAFQLPPDRPFNG